MLHRQQGCRHHLADVVDKVKLTDADAKRLREARRIVVRNPRVMGGEPHIKGTRVPVYMIGNLAAIEGVDEALAAYPFLGREKIELALVYVTAFPGRYEPDLSWLYKLRKTAPTRRERLKIQKS